MPNISAHMIIAKEVGELLNINHDDFIRGNLLPDIIDIEDSHKKIVSGVYLVPDIEYFLNTLDLSSYMNIGYLTHLLLDKYYLEEYLSNLYPNENIFIDGIIYSDYDYINYYLVDKFKLDTKRLGSILSNYDCKIKEEKLEYNIECLKQKRTGITKYLDEEDFSIFLLEVSKRISKELIEYAHKYKELSICIGQ